MTEPRRAGRRATEPPGGGQPRRAATRRPAVAEGDPSAEEALRASEAKYRTLLDSIDVGFCTIEVLLDDGGQPHNSRILETNPAFVRLTGLVDAAGRTIRELLPAYEPYWLEIFGRVALTGEPTRFEAPAAALGRWYDVYAFRTGEPAAHRVAMLFTDITERVRAETALREREAQLDAEVGAMRRLHALTRRLVEAPKAEEMLSEVLDGIVDLQGADFGNVQLYEPASETLVLAAHRGFDQAFLERFRVVDAADTTSCGRALAQRARVIIEDVEADADYAPHRAEAARCGYRAVQSTPIFGRDGQLLGMLSTHFRQPHHPSERDLRLTDLYAQVAVELLERAEDADRRERLAVAEAVAVERQALFKRIVLAQEDERRRVAHEVHDGLTQLAHAAALRLDAVAEDLVGTAPAGVLQDLERARDLTRQAAAEARRLISGLRPEPLDQLGLAHALQAEVDALRADGWRATFEQGGTPCRRLSEEEEIALYRVAQEALANVRKHVGRSQARVRVRLEEVGGHARLEVRDWGRGFDPAAVKPDPATGEHVGLAGMRERLALVGGTLHVRSGPDHGTTVRAFVPLQQGANA